MQASPHTATGNTTKARLDIGRERELVARARAGRAGAFRELADAHHDRIVALARQHRWLCGSEADLVQEGYLGLLSALEGFDPERGIRFWSYARWWVRARVAGFASRNHRIVPETTSRAYRAVAFKLRRVEADLSQQNGTPPSNDLVAEALGIKEADVARVRHSLRQGDVSYDETEYATWGISHGGPSPEEQFADRERPQWASAWLDHALSTLSSRERDIVERRHLADPGQSFTDLGRRHGVSRERIRQLERRAIRKMRSVIESKEAERLAA